MATIRTWCERLSEIMGIPLSEARQRANALRVAGFLPQGGRGRHAAHCNTEHVVNLLLGLMSRIAYPAVQTGQAVKEIHALRRSEFSENVMPRLLLDLLRLPDALPAYVRVILRRIGSNESRIQAMFYSRMALTLFRYTHSLVPHVSIPLDIGELFAGARDQNHSHFREFLGIADWEILRYRECIARETASIQYDIDRGGYSDQDRLFNLQCSLEERRTALAHLEKSIDNAAQVLTDLFYSDGSRKCPAGTLPGWFSVVYCTSHPAHELPLGVYSYNPGFTCMPLIAKYLIQDGELNTK